MTKKQYIFSQFCEWFGNLRKITYESSTVVHELKKRLELFHMFGISYNSFALVFFGFKAYFLARSTKPRLSIHLILKVYLTIRRTAYAFVVTPKQASHNARVHHMSCGMRACH